MSIIQELYNIFDKEYSKHLKRKSSKNLLVIELSQNLAFIREGLNANLNASTIIAGLEDEQYKNANKNALNLNTIQKKALAKKTYSGVTEFNKYQSWSTKKLIDKAYERIATLKKLNLNSEKINVHLRLQYLFKYLMVLIAHIEGKSLKLKIRG